MGILALWGTVSVNITAKFYPREVFLVLTYEKNGVTDDIYFLLKVILKF